MNVLQNQIKCLSYLHIYIFVGMVWFTLITKRDVYFKYSFLNIKIEYLYCTQHIGRCSRVRKRERQRNFVIIIITLYKLFN